MAFPTTGILDNFNRANEGPPPSANWTTGPTIFTNGLRVVSNQVETASSVSEAYWNDSTFGPDCEVFCTVAASPGSNPISIFLRLQNIGAGTTDGYLASFAAATNALFVFRLDNGTPTQLAIANDGLAAGDVIGFSAYGNTLTGYRNGSSVITATDSTYPTGGNIGVRLSDTPHRIDNFGGGTGTNLVPSAVYSRITSNPSVIIADGASTSAVAVETKNGYDEFLTSGGATVTLAATDGTLTGVTDNGNGTYSATLTASLDEGTPTITGTLNGVALTDEETVTFIPVPPPANPNHLFLPRPTRSGIRIDRGS